MKTEDKATLVLVLVILGAVSFCNLASTADAFTSINAEVRNTLDPYFEAMGVDIISSQLEIGGNAYTEFFAWWGYGNSTPMTEHNAVKSFVTAITKNEITTVFAWKQYTNINYVEGMEDQTGAVAEDIRYSFVSDGIYYALVFRNQIVVRSYLNYNQS